MQPKIAGLPLTSLYTPATISLHHASAQCNATCPSRIMANIGFFFFTAPSTTLHSSQTSKWSPGRLQCSPTKAVEPMTQLVFPSHHRSPSRDKFCRNTIPWFGANSRNNGQPSHARLPPATRGTHGRPNSWRRTIRSVGLPGRDAKGQEHSPLSHNEHGQASCFSGPLHAFANTTNLITAPPTRIV